MKHKTSSALLTAALLLPQLLQINFVHAADAPQLFKIKNNSAVYWITGSTRSAFPLTSVYQSWFGTSFDSVVEVSPETLSQYTLTKNVFFNTGSLIKIQTDPKVYKVLDTAGHITWIPTEAEFLAAGYSFKDIRDVPDTLFSDYAVVASDFATPQNTPNQQPTSTSTPIISAPNGVFGINDIALSSAKNIDGSVQENISFATTEPATVVFDYAPIESSTSSISFESGTVFKKTVTVSSGVDYRYVVTATNAQGKITRASGEFTTYSDVTVSGIVGLVPHNAPLAVPVTLLGGFSITNNSSESRTLNQIVLEFDSSSFVTQSVSKTLRITTLLANNSIGDTLAERNFGAGTSIVNSQNIQKIAVEQIFAPGETRRFGVVLTNLDQINLDITSPTDTFIPLLQPFVFQGDTTVHINNAVLGTLYYARQ
ncbi:MAG: hypothetical protein NT003_01460 [Candidatus Magasanikbacteria bacterium]|nr:hypothetical protein [Candidatus Magasanikbacteria bacterium]